MAARGTNPRLNQVDSRLRSEEGQSLLEFLFLFPVLLAFPFVLVKISTAIQMSIVNQQHARAHVFFVAHNSPYFPKRHQQRAMLSKDTNQVVMGISDNNLRTDTGDGSTYSPKASTYSIARNPAAGGRDTDDKQPTERTNVRVRNTFSLCANSVSMSGGNGDFIPAYGPSYVVREVRDSKAYRYCATKLEGMGGVQ